MAYLPDDPYLYRQDEPNAAPNRPISQGDVFVDIPLIGAARPNEKQAGSWVATKPRTGPNALGMLVPHPCASRSQTTYRLNPTVSVAPVVRRPEKFEKPWAGHLHLFPLPSLRLGEDYVAKLDEAVPVAREALDGHRIACLNAEGLTALFHRHAMNRIRYPEIPAHFDFEAERLTNETDLWEWWVKVRGTEDGFQQWLDEPFGGQLKEDQEGAPVPGSAEPTGEKRRATLVWNIDDLRAELRAELGEDP